MTREAGTARWWTAPPARQVSYLAGADPELLGMALDPLPALAPAVVRFRPAVGAPLGDLVAVLLDELERVAVATFPRWLPGAERIDRSAGGLAIGAAGALAAQAAARSPDFGPLLADLAERGVRARAGEPVDLRPRRRHLPAEVRAAGLGRVIAQAYGRGGAALLLEVPPDLGPADEQSLVAAAEWLAGRGGVTVWLAGAPLRFVDRVRVVPVDLPPYLTDLAAEADLAVAGGAGAWVESAPTAALLRYPPLSGVPRYDSAAEQALERALAPHQWAKGRRWNHPYQGHLLSRPYRLDLYWPAERLVVEVDGDDHRRPRKFADDRRRDVALAEAGHVVLRFTNDEVLTDVQNAVASIGRQLGRRRAEPTDHTEMRQHVHY